IKEENISEGEQLLFDFARIAKLENKVNYIISLVDNYKEEKNSNEAKIKEINDKIDEVNKLKVQIFSIMALFFGIFAFISVDVSFTKDLISISFIESVIKTKPSLKLFFVNISPNYAPALLFILSQFIFFTCIYFFLLRKFFNKTSSLYVSKEPYP